ncbi:MAG: glycosyltransferase [Acidobacteria bacterium]|nr:MAG: glycosyltransferase [Acidobacteriota bacterium]
MQPGSTMSSFAPSDLRLDYVSPLPPVRTGISDYSVDLLTGLERLGALADASSDDRGGTVRVVRVGGQQVAPEVAARFRPVSWERLGEDGRTPLYQVGNNLHHERIVESAIERPGLVTLHDVFLHHLLIERTLGRTDLEAYVEQMRREHGWVGAAVALPPRWSVYAQAGMFALPAHRSLLERQAGVVVHSEWARRTLVEEGVRAAVAVVPMPMPAPPLDERTEQRANALRRSWGVPDDAPLLGSFGFQTPIKRTASAVRALTREPLRTAHLVVGGEQSPGLGLDLLARELGVADRVHLVGFLPADDFAPAIRACDLCVNLRYPTAGETSASLLRIFALGRATVVSDYAQFRDLPGAFALRVPLGDDPADPSLDAPEVLALARVCGESLARPEELRDRGGAARLWIEREHDPGRCAEVLLAACGELTRGGRGGRGDWAGAASQTQDAPDVAAPTSLTWGELQCSLSLSGLDGWRPGELRTLELLVRNDGFATWLPSSAGPGGLMLEVDLRDEHGDAWGPRRWPGLSRRLDPGSTWRVRLPLRRPLAAARLEIEPHLVGGVGLRALRGSGLRVDLPPDGSEARISELESTRGVGDACI